MAQARVICSATPTAGIQLSTSRAITLTTSYSEPDRAREDSKEEEHLLKQFDIQRFLSKLLQDEYSFKAGHGGNRFRVFFAHMFMQVTKISRHKQGSQYSAWMMQRLTDLEKLLYEALHSIDDNFELWFDIAYNAEYLDIIQLLPNEETLSFYEAMVNAAKRHSKLQYGIMLSSFGVTLTAVHKGVSEGYDQYQKALDVLTPLGDGMDLARLNLRIAEICYNKAMYNETER